MSEPFHIFCEERLRNKVVDGEDARSREGFWFLLIFFLLFCVILLVNLQYKCPWWSLICKKFEIYLTLCMFFFFYFLS